LELIVDQSGREVGYQTLKNAISVLDGNITPYKFHLIQHRLFMQDDQETVRKLLNEIENNRDLYQKSPVINQENEPAQNTGVDSTKP
jgi:hypothetical protein